MGALPMPAITFDTHRFVKKLVAVGFTEQQAEVFAEQQTELVVDKLATKQDIWLLREEFENFRKEMRQEMEVFRQEVRHEMEVFKQEIKQEMEVFKQEIRQEMEVFKKEIRQEIEVFKQEIKQEMKELELRMTIKLGTMMIAGFSIFAAITKLL